MGTPPPQAAIPGAGQTLALLSTLTVAPEHLGSPAYDRDTWDHWIDEDKDGCDTRAEVLLMEASVAPTVGPSCTLTGGSWWSTYDQVQANGPTAVEIDHLVALAEAHRSGGWAWDEARKRAFANDLVEHSALMAVTVSANRSKGDRDPAAWLPPAQAWRCPYIQGWIRVKAKWGLAVDAEEATMLSDMLLGECSHVDEVFYPTGS